MPQIPCDKIFIPNTTTKIFVDSSGVQTQYCIYPDEGFVIHLKRNDVEDFDPITEQTTTTLYFSSGMKSVNINYNFSVKVQDAYTYTDENGNEVTMPIEKIGAEEIFTLPKTIVQEATDENYF